jgi:hypothetical protein
MDGNGDDSRCDVQIVDNIVEASANLPAASTSASVEPQAARARGSSRAPNGTGARFIQTETLATLVSSYHRHFSAYSKTKRRVVQRVPGKVWKQVYADCKDEVVEACQKAGMEYNDQTLPAERTLQDALRAALDPDTGVSDREGATKVVPQSEDILRALKKSDGHARRVMLRHRDSIMAGERASRAGISDGAGEQEDVASDACGEGSLDTTPRPDQDNVGCGEEDSAAQISNDSNLSKQVPPASGSRRSS